MSGWIVPIVTALIGLAGGALVRPYVDHLLSRRSILDTEQRQMMEAWLTISRRRAMYFLAGCSSVGNGEGVAQASVNIVGSMEKWIRGSELVAKYPWEPARIHNRSLREKFESLSDVFQRMLRYTLAAAKDEPLPDEFTTTLMNDVNVSEALREEIVAELSKYPAVVTNSSSQTG